MDFPRGTDGGAGHQHCRCPARGVCYDGPTTRGQKGSGFGVRRCLQLDRMLSTVSLQTNCSDGSRRGSCGVTPDPAAEHRFGGKEPGLISFGSASAELAAQETAVHLQSPRGHGAGPPFGSFEGGNDLVHPHTSDVRTSVTSGGPLKRGQIGGDPTCPRIEPRDRHVLRCMGACEWGPGICPPRTPPIFTRSRDLNPGPTD